MDKMRELTLPVNKTSGFASSNGMLSSYVANGAHDQNQQQFSPKSRPASRTKSVSRTQRSQSKNKAHHPSSDNINGSPSKQNNYSGEHNIGS